MAPANTPHDTLFRALLGHSRRAAELLHAHLPSAITVRLADRLPERVDGTFVDERLRNSQSDRLFRVYLRDGRPAYIYVLLEHKSEPDPATPLQLLKYMTRIWEQVPRAEQGRLPPIIPLVVYHGAQTWTVPRSVVDALDADSELRDWMRDLRYLLLDLGEISDADLASEPETRSGLMALKYAYRRDRLERVADILRGLRDGSFLERQVVTYIVDVFRDLTPERLRAAVRRAKPGQEDRMPSLAAEQWRREGWDDGLKAGEARGKAEAIIGVLRARFGDLAVGDEQRIRNAPPEKLDGLLQRAATSESLSDVLR